MGLRIPGTILIVVIAVLTLPWEAIAQVPPPSTPPAAVPLDIFSVVLLASGAGYGIRKMRKTK